MLPSSVTGIGTTGKTLDPEKGSIVKADFEKAIELTGNFVISFLSLYQNTYIRIYVDSFQTMANFTTSSSRCAASSALARRWT